MKKKNEKERIPKTLTMSRIIEEKGKRRTRKGRKKKKEEINYTFEKIS